MLERARCHAILFRVIQPSLLLEKRRSQECMLGIDNPDQVVQAKYAEDSTYATLQIMQKQRCETRRKQQRKHCKHNKHTDLDLAQIR